MLEIEAKIRVDDLAVIRDRLRACGARRVGRYIEGNHILDRADGLLRRSGCGLRVRGVETLSGEKASATLTLKGPVLESRVKSREEIELDIGDAERMLSLLTAVGFEMVVSFRKRRERWNFGDCHIELDEVPLLGTFVEIEGLTEEAVDAARRSVSLGEEPHVRAGYVGMLLNRCRELNRSAVGIDFEKG